MLSNAKRWERARFTRSTKINAQAAKIEANRARYEQVAKATGAPWDVIGVIHCHEAINAPIDALARYDRPWIVKC